MSVIELSYDDGSLLLSLILLILLIEMVVHCKFFPWSPRGCDFSCFLVHRQLVVLGFLVNFAKHFASSLMVCEVFDDRCLDGSTSFYIFVR